MGSWVINTRITHSGGTGREDVPRGLLAPWRLAWLSWRTRLLPTYPIICCGLVGADDPENGTHGLHDICERITCTGLHLVLQVTDYASCSSQAIHTLLVCGALVAYKYSYEGMAFW